MIGGLAALDRAWPPWLERALDRLHRDLVDARSGNVEAWRAGNVCDGAAGEALLWARAFEVTKQALYRDRAREAADACVDPAGLVTSQLCCGLGGRAYALLALNRIEPCGAWRARAVHLAAPWMGPLRTEWPLGVLQGYAGVACLAVDLATSSRGARFPILDA